MNERVEEKRKGQVRESGSKTLEKERRRKQERQRNEKKKDEQRVYKRVRE